MKKIFSFGKIDFYGKGVKNNAVTVEIEYKKKGNEKVFSACGNVWNCRHTDIICGGQCLDELANYIPVSDPVFGQILRLWRLYHLNDMHAECIHQNAAGWLEKAKTPVNIYTFKMTNKAISLQSSTKNRIFKTIVNGESYKATPEEIQILTLSYFKRQHTDKLPAAFDELYTIDKTEEKTLGWLSPEDHPDGLLGRACPVCGYKYGHGWNYFPIPADDEKIIFDLLGVKDIDF